MTMVWTPSWKVVGVVVYIFNPSGLRAYKDVVDVPEHIKSKLYHT